MTTDRDARKKKRNAAMRGECPATVVVSDRVRRCVRRHNHVDHYYRTDKGGHRVFAADPQPAAKTTTMRVVTEVPRGGTLAEVKARVAAARGTAEKLQEVGAAVGAAFDRAVPLADRMRMVIGMLPDDGPAWLDQFLAQTAVQVAAISERLMNTPLRAAAQTPEIVQALIAEECDAVRELLLAKNRDYGNSALDPVRIFSRAAPVEQILVRLDDKLSRLARGSAGGEDVERDLLGYLVLLRVARRLAVAP